MYSKLHFSEFNRMPLGARELVTLAMLKQIQDGTVLFPKEPCILGRCKEEYQTGDFKGQRVSLGGCSASGGLVVSRVDADSADDGSGLFCLLVVFFVRVRQAKCVNNSG